MGPEPERWTRKIDHRFESKVNQLKYWGQVLKLPLSINQVCSRPEKDTYFLFQGHESHENVVGMSVEIFLG